MHGGSPKAGLSQASTEGLARANLADLERQRPTRRPNLHLVGMLVITILVGWAVWELLT